MASNGAAELHSGEFSRRQVEDRGHIMAQDLGDAAQQQAVFRLAAQWLECLAGLDIRWHDHWRLGPGQEPDCDADQRQQERSEEDNQDAVLLPEGGRYLCVWRT